MFCAFQMGNTENNNNSKMVKPKCDSLALQVEQPRQHIKKQRYYFANKGPCSQSYGFFSSHVWM